MRALAAVARNELRLLRHDPVPAVVLVAMPVVLMLVLSPALGLALAALGRPDVPGSAQAVPGMICVFSWFSVAIVSFTLFREHTWRTWVRLRIARLPTPAVVTGKLAVPALLLLAQHALIIAIGVLALDLRATGSWAVVALTSALYSLLVLALGLLAAALFRTIQQVNAATNLPAMVFGGLGGALVPVAALPAWMQPLAPLSPTYWAMRAYTGALIDGWNLPDAVPALAVLAAAAAATLLAAAHRLHVDTPRHTWS